MTNRDKSYATGFAPRPTGRLTRARRVAANVLRSTLCASLITQSTFISYAQAQQVILDPNGNVGFAPTVQNTSPAPTVNIATPNSGGVSVNQYSNFSIDEHGVVLNNSTTGGASVLNGSVAANPNLVGGAADTIVNEVTSLVASTLSGPTEVAGQRADVIIANPNGVTCNGCSFINTGQATLSSGRPVVNGSVVTLDVRTGTVTIGANGLDGAATGVDGVNLVGRAVIVNGTLTAIEQITASGGAQRFNVKTRRATSQAGTGTAPEYAVDAANFGAMQAGQIQIIGNELGLGVRTLGALDATSGNLTLGSQGDLTIKSGRATGNVVLNAAGTVHQERDLSSLEGTVTIEGQNYTSTERSGIYGRDGIYLTASQTAQISGQWQSRELISVGANDIFLDGVMRTDGTLRLTASNNIEAIGLAALADTITLNAGGLTHIDASYFTALTGFTITTDSFHLGQSNVFTAPDIITVDVAGTFMNGADLRNYTNLDITFGGSLINLATGVFAQDDLDLTVNGTITNEGILIGEDTATLTADELINTSTGIIAGGDVSFAFSGDITNDGLIEATASLTLASGGDVINRGVIVAPTLIADAVNLTNEATGIIALNDAGTITVSADLVNVGEITAVNSLDITADGSLINLNLIGANDTVALAANALVNAGLVFSGDTLTLTSTTSLANLGRLESQNTLSLSAGTILASSGEIDAGGILSITSSTTSLVAGSSTIANSLDLSSDTVTASGFLAINDDLVITAATSFAQNGTLYAAGDLSITTGSLTTGTGSATVAGVNFADNTVPLDSAASIILAASSADLDGLVVSGGALDASFTGAANIAGSLESGNSLTLTAGSLTTTAAARLIATTDADCSTTGDITHNGTLYGQVTDLSAGGALSTGATSLIGAADTTTLSGNSIDNGGLVFASNAVLATALSTLANSGRIESQNTLTLIAGTVLSNAGQIDAAGLLALTATDLSFAGGSSTLASSLNANANTLTNAGTIAVDGTLALSISDAVTQNGALYTSGSLEITTASLTTGAGSTTAAGVNLADLTAPLDAAADVILTSATSSLNGLLLAGGDIAATSTGTTDVLGELRAGDRLTLTAAGLSTGVDAELISGTDINLTSSSFLTTAGTVDAGTDVTLTAVTTLTNSGFVRGQGTATLTGADIAQNGDVIANNVVLNAANSFSQTGSSVAVMSLNLTAGGTASINGQFASYGDLTANAQNLDVLVAGEVIAQNITLTATDALSNAGIIDSTINTVVTAGTTLTNTGEIDADGNLTLTAADILNDATGVISGLNTTATATATLTNRGDLGATGLLDLDAGTTFTNAGSLRANAIDLAANDINITATGTLNANVAALTATDTFTNAGDLIAQDWIQIQADAATNSGLILSANETKIIANSLVNTATGQIESQTAVRIAALNGLTNAGSIESLGLVALQVDNGNVTNSGTVNADQTYVTASGTIAGNQGSFIGQSLTSLTANDIADLGNAGATRLGQLGIAASGADYALDLATGGLDMATGDELVVSGNLTLTLADDITNAGLIRAGGDLSLTTDGDITNNEGVIKSGADMGLFAANGTLTNDAGIIEADGNLEIVADQVINGVMTTVNEDYFEVNGVRFVYADVLAAAQARYGAGITEIETGRCYSYIDPASSNTCGGSAIPASQILIDQFGATIDVWVPPFREGEFPEGNTATTAYPDRGNPHVAEMLSYPRDLRHSGVANIFTQLTDAEVLSSSDASYVRSSSSVSTGTATIHSGGALSITADDVTNAASTISAETSINITANNFENLTEGGFLQSTLFFDSLPTQDTSYGHLIRRVDDLTITGQQGLLVSNGGITINASQSNTNFGTIDGNSIALLGGQITSGISGTTVDAVGINALVVDLTDFVALAIRSTPTTSLTSTDLTGPSVSVGLLTGTEQTGDGATTTATDVGTGTGSATIINPGTAVPGTTPLPDAEYTNGPSGVIVQPDYTLPTGVNADAPVFSRDDLFAAIGANPNMNFLADPNAEAEALRLASLNQTGRNFLHDDWETVEEQQEELTQNARDFANTHPGAQIGKALTDAQIAALDAPILWYVEKLVDGKKVLVPTLYLSANEKPRNPPGSLITTDSLFIDGRNVRLANIDISANDVTLQASGRLNATDVVIEATNQIILNSGRGDINVSDLLGSGTQASVSLSAGRDLIMDQDLLIGGSYTAIAGRDINQSGISVTATSIGYQAGRNVNLTPIKTVSTAVHQLTTEQTVRVCKATGGGRDGDRCLRWETEVRTVPLGPKTTTVSEELQAPSLNATGDITILAGNDINFQGTTLNSGANILLDADGDIKINPVKLVQTSTEQISGTGQVCSGGKDERTCEQVTRVVGETTTRAESLAASALNADGNITLYSGENIRLTALDLNAGGDLVAAGRSVEIAALTTKTDADRISSRGFFGFWAAPELKSSSETLHTSNLTVGGDVTIQAATDLTLRAVQLDATGDLNLVSFGNLFLDADSAKTTSTTYAGRSTTERGRSVATATSLTSGGDFLALALGDATLVGTQIRSGGTAGLSAGGDVILAATQDVESYSYRYQKKSLFKKKTITEDRLDVLNKGTSIISEGDLTITSGSDLTTAGTELASNAGNIVLDAAQNILAGTYEDTHYYSYSKSSSYFGGLLSKSTASTVLQKINTGTDALAEVDLTLISGEDTTLIGASLGAGGTLTLDVGGDLNIQAAVDSVRTSYSESNIGAITATTITETSYDEVAHLTTFTANNYDFDVDGDINLTVYTDQTDGVTGGTRPEITLTGIVLPGIITPEVNQDTEPDLAALVSGLYPAELLEQDGLNFLEQELAHEYFYEKTTALSPAFKALLTIVVTQGIGTWSALGSVGTIGGTAASAWTTGLQAFSASAIVGGIEGIVSGDFDLGEILEGAAFSGITAGLTAGINLDDIGINVGGGNIIPGLGSGQFTWSGLLESGLDGAINSGLSSAVYGTDFGDGLIASVTNYVANGLAAAGIEYVSHGLELGDLETIIAKATLNCLAAEAKGADCHAGALGSLVTEVFAGSRLGADNEQEYTNRLELVAAVAGYFASKGEADNVLATAMAALIDFENNCMLAEGHNCETKFKLEQCKGLSGNECDALYDAYQEKGSIANAIAILLMGGIVIAAIGPELLAACVANPTCARLLVSLEVADAVDCAANLSPLCLLPGPSGVPKKIPKNVDLDISDVDFAILHNTPPGGSATITINGTSTLVTKGADGKILDATPINDLPTTVGVPEVIPKGPPDEPWLSRLVRMLEGKMDDL